MPWSIYKFADYKIFSAAYVLSIVVVNVMFTTLPKLHFEGGAVVPVAAFFVGFVFIIRDFSQREVGHYVVAFMALGGLLSYIFADRNVALASLIAFMISELIDWVVYSLSNLDLRGRIIFSSLVAIPIDIIIFLYLLPFPGALNWISIILVSVLKFSTVIFLFLFRFNSEKATP